MAEEPVNKRIEWVDILKGMGIFLVILGHNVITPTAFGYIYSFHMPLFFFVSGYLFSPDKYPHFWKFLKQKVRTILLPYFFFFLLIYVYWAVVFEKLWKNSDAYLQPFFSILYGSTHLNISIVFLPLWFLPCLFLTELFFYLIKKWGGKYFLFPVLLFSMVGYALSLFSPVLPWSVNTALIALIFFSVGFLLKKHRINILLLKFKSRLLIVTAFLLLTADFIFFKINKTIDLLYNHYQNFALFLLGAFGGIFGLALIAYLLNDKKAVWLRLLKFWGQNSLIIFALHPIGLALVKKGVSLIPGASSIFIDDHRLLSIALIYSLLCVFILTPAILILPRFFPFVFATGKIRNYLKFTSDGHTPVRDEIKRVFSVQ